MATRGMVIGSVQIKLEESGYSEGKTSLKDANEKTGGVQESCLDIAENDWQFGVFQKKNSSLNFEPQLLHSDEENLERIFWCAASDRILQSKQIVQSATDQSLMVGPSKVSTADEVFIQERSTSESNCEVLHIHKMVFGDDRPLSSTKARAMELRTPSKGKNACSIDIGVSAVAVYFGSLYSKQDNEIEQTSDCEVKKTIDTDGNHLSVVLSGHEQIVKYNKEVLYGSSQTF